MAQTLVVDLGGTFATVAIAVDRDLNLSLENISRVRDALKPLVGAEPPAKPEKSRPARKRRPPAPPAAADDDPGRVDRREMRQWCKAHGYEVGDFGRIPSEAKEAYEESQRAWSESSKPTPLTLAKQNGRTD